MAIQTLAIYMVVYLIGMRVFKTYSGIMRLTTSRDIIKIGMSMLVSSVIAILIIPLVDMIPMTVHIPKRVFAICFMAGSIAMVLVRVLVREVFTIMQKQQKHNQELLPRNPIKIDMESIGDMLRDRKIVVTGAAGSIGSEMVRQIAKFEPKMLILIDQAETPMHDIKLMMKRDWAFINSETIVASISNKGRMTAIFEKYRPEYVFHAAAYKHVPMMEDNPSESVHNNILGTKILADLAVEYGVKKFVMISTDKAVNPTNVMGCSKRICEIYVQSLNEAIKRGELDVEVRTKDKKLVTQFVTTRFGNVLGSNGSVIPLFKKQIEEGGPVTVTHPDITRYFMLIPEACQLVLEAGTMGKGGEIFVFDMGEPVRISDLAKRMINISGRADIKIVYTGLRNGEKLYEEVLDDKETTKPTVHPKIKVATVRQTQYAEASAEIDKLIDIADSFDEMAIVKQMKYIVPEFKSNQSRFEVLDNED